MNAQQISMLDAVESDHAVFTCSVIPDEITESISNKFDYAFSGKIVTNIKVPTFPEKFHIGLIIGSSGSGKTQMLRMKFGDEKPIVWNNDKAIISCFHDEQDAIDRLCATGLCSIPSWLKPYHVLSTGEKFRADLARRISDYAVIDEFTSTVNREVAKSCSIAIAKYIRKNKFRNVVFASCHNDIAEYLQPDWIYDMDTQQFYTGRYLQRKPMELHVVCCSPKAWIMFRQHHYLSGDINKTADCYMAVAGETPVAFVAVLAFPFGGCTNAKREHRLVVLPDFQGIGIGNALSECIAKGYVKAGYRYFSKTANPKCGVHRDNSPLWKATSHNHSARQDYLHKDGSMRVSNKPYKSQEISEMYARRICYSHEYIGG